VREGVAGPTETILGSKRKPRAISWPAYALLAVGIMIFAGFGLRLTGLGNIGFAEDEINKLEAVRAYDRKDFSANAEHPMLMKALMDVSLRGARVLNGFTGGTINEEAISADRGAL